MAEHRGVTRLPEGFEHALVTGEVPTPLRAFLGDDVDTLRLAAAEEATDHPLHVSAVISAVRSGSLAARPAGTTLVLTSRVLVASGTPPLFGFADRRRGVAIVSTARIGCDEPRRMARRVANVIAHERGHLDGLRHCATPGCVMQAVGTLDGLDARSDEPCGRCPRARVGRTAAAALALASLSAFVFLGLDVAVRRREPPPLRPFACVPAAGGTGFVLEFNGTPVEWAGPDGAARRLPCRDAEAASRLNDLFQQVDPTPLGVVPTAAGGATVRHEDVVIVEIPPAPSGSPAAADLGVRWAREVDSLLAGKGRRAEVCPSCHLDRPRDMQVARRAGVRR
jgi:predicted Zn-dependent protease